MLQEKQQTRHMILFQFTGQPQFACQRGHARPWVPSPKNQVLRTQLPRQTQLTSGGSDASSAAIEDFSHFATPLDSQSDDSCFGDSQEDVKCLQDLTEAPPSRDVSGCDEVTFEETTTATQAQLTSGGSDASSSAIEETSHFDTTPDSQADDSCFADSADDVCLLGWTEVPPSRQVPACDEPMPAASCMKWLCCACCCQN